MQEPYYIDKLYPFQDEILKIIEDLNSDFYLTGGTALGRCYLNHRYSDDLDFFVNNNDNFKSGCNAAINALKDRWIDPIEICRILDQFPIERLATIKWITAPNIKEFENQLKSVHLDIFNGRENSLKA